MKPILKPILKPTAALSALVAGLALCLAARAAPPQDYLYTPAEGVHETQFFHGCYDNTDHEKRPKIKVIMNGLSTEDVFIETGEVENGKPSTEMVTYRLKYMNASLRVAFRNHDGAHCQQGAQTIVFKNATLHSRAELAKYR